MSEPRSENNSNADSTIRVFKLTSALVAGATASAKFMRTDATWSTNTFTVSDVIDEFSGDIDAKGYAMFIPGLGVWAVIQIACG